MHWLLSVLIFVGTVTSALAAPIVIRSGEHNDFTRFVLHLPADLEWRSEEIEGGLRLEFSDPTPDFDLSQAFARIGRDRVSAISRTETGVELTFECRCQAKAFLSGRRMLVVDVSPHTGPVQPKQELVPTLPDPAKTLARARTQPQTSPLAKENEIQMQEDRVVDAELAKQRLFKQLGRAASMGLVELTIPDDTVDSIDLIDTSSQQVGMFAHQAGIAASPVMSPEVESETLVESVSEKGVDCPPDSVLDTSGWAHGDGFTSGLHQLRAQLGGEIVPIEKQAALRLARHYLAFGFGAEAQLLLPYAGDSSEIRWLQFVANIVDGRDGAATKALGQYASCPTSVAMWAVLTQDPEMVLSFDSKPVVRAFADLTVPLQDVLAPRLGDTLIAHGEDEAAQTVLRIANRRTSSTSADLDRLGARLHAKLGNEERAVEGFVKTVQADAPIAPIALAELIETEIRLGRAISSETVDLLASYYQQHRRDEIGTRLLTVLILANALAGQFDASWTLMENAHDEIKMSTAVRSDFVSALAEHAEDLDALRYGTILARRGAKLTASANRSMAERLVEIGFPELARKFLSVPVQGGDEHARKILLAKLALGESQYLEAKAHLLGVAGPDVDKLLEEIAMRDEGVAQETHASQLATAQPIESLQRSKASLSASRDLREQLSASLDKLIVEEVHTQ